MTAYTGDFSVFGRQPSLSIGAFEASSLGTVSKLSFQCLWCGQIGNLVDIS